MVSRQTDNFLFFTARRRPHASFFFSKTYFPEPLLDVNIYMAPLIILLSRYLSPANLGKILDRLERRDDFEQEAIPWLIALDVN